MKNLLPILCIGLLFLTSKPVSAHTPDPNIKLSRVVKTLLLAPDVKVDFHQKVRISFFVTTDKKLVVLKTDAQRKKMDNFIKLRLNYKKINIPEVESNRVYTIKVDFDISE